MRIIISCLTAFIAFALPLPPAAHAFQAEVIPSQIRPGDAFMVQITVDQSSDVPAASFKKKKLPLSSCGEGCYIAVGAAGLATEPGNYTVSIKSGDRSRNLVVKVLQTHFPEIHLTLPDKKVFLNDKDLARAQKEAETLKAIWIKDTERLWKGKFVLPLENEISTQFGLKRIINKKKNSRHRGMDIRGKKGEEVRASNRGRVVLAEELFFGGKTVILDHGQGIYTIYMHLSDFKAKRDAVVSKGEVVGLVGATGRATGPHLHFGVKVLNINANPVSLIGLVL
jgi:murein DD-endopeptidase MepM/ murein hydrolase activator NlpD